MLGGLAALLLTLGAAGCATQERALGSAVSQLEADPWRKLVELGHASREKGDLKTAAQFYSQAHSQAPGEPLPLVHLGATLAELGRVREATGTYRAALELQPGNARALLGLGNALIKLDQPLAALQQFETRLEQSPDDLKALSGAGVAADLAGDGARAQTYLRRGLEVAPDDVTLLNNLGYSLILSADYTEAIALLEMAVAQPDSTTQHRQNLALAYGLAGREAQAARMIRMDFGDDEVERNLAYYRARRGSAPAAPKQSRAPLGLSTPLAAAPVETVEEDATPRDSSGTALSIGGFLAD
jgi:Flp pilus assembly protein TadD